MRIFIVYINDENFPLIFLFFRSNFMMNDVKVFFYEHDADALDSHRRVFEREMPTTSTSVGNHVWYFLDDAHMELCVKDSLNLPSKRKKNC